MAATPKESLMSVTDSLKQIADASTEFYKAVGTLSKTATRMLERMKRSANYGNKDFYFFPAKLPKKALKELKQLGLEPIEISGDPGFYNIHFSIKD
jgi:hypothetical protein